MYAPLPALVALWSNTPTNARGAWQPEGPEFNSWSLRKNVMLLSVHALRLISGTGKRGFSGVLYNLWPLANDEFMTLIN